MALGPALLFRPGDRPERYAKAAAAADSVIIDLEDTVGPDSKDAARAHLLESDLDPARTIVRVNPAQTPEFERDIIAIEQTRYRIVMLPKAEIPDDLTRLDGFEVIPICESPLGVRNAESLADDDRVVSLTWGAEDLVAAMGGRSSRFADGHYREFARYARSRVLLAATSAGKSAIDTAHLDISDEDGLRGEALDAAASGFAGTLCIHPRQVEIVRAAFELSDESVAWAQSVLAAAAASPNPVFSFEGRMIDGPIIRQASQIVEASRVGGA